MKHTWKRIAALTLTGAMCLSLFGCGDKKDDENHKLLSDELGFGYTAAYQDLDAELEYLQSAVSANGKLYLHGNYYDEESMESGSRIYELDPATGKTSQVPMPELVSSENTHENIQSIALSPDGSGYWMVTETYTYTPVPDGYEDYVPTEAEPADEAPAEDGEAPAAEGEAPAEEAPADDAGLSAGYEVNLLTNTVPAEDAAAPADDGEDAPQDEEAPAEDAAPVEEDGTEEPAGTEAETPIAAPVDTSENQNSYAAKKFDMNGELLHEINLNDVAAENEWFYCQGLAQDGDGYLYIVLDQGTILCYDNNYTRQADIALDTYYVQSLITVGSGAVLASYFESEGDGTAVVRIEKGSVAEPMHPQGINETGNLFLYGGDGDTVLISDQTYLYNMNAATGEATKLLSWLDSDINANSISGVAGSEDTLQVVLSSYAHGTGESSFELGTLTKTPAEELPERTIITMGGLYPDDQVTSAVVKFNRTNPDYRITMVDYNSYNTTEDYTLGTKQMDMDVVSGNAPDIIDLSNGSVEKYISKGALADLSSLLKKDETLSQDDLMSGPLQAYTRDGKLYGLPYSFGIRTLYGSAKLLGDKTSWTLQEMTEVFDGLNEDVSVMAYTTQSLFLSMMLYVNLADFVDYTKGTCSFDSEQFKALLQAASRLPSDEDNGEAIEYTYSDADEIQLQQGDTLLTTGYISSSYEIRNLANLYVKKNGVVNIGFPTEEGSGAVMNVYGGYGISAGSKEKDGAWAFIKSLLAEDFQKEQYSLPVNAAVFDSMLEELKERPYYMDGGEKVYTDSSYYIGETEYMVDPLTDEQTQEFKDYVNNISQISTAYDEDLMNIITEEAAAFFAGDKSVDETADLIQNKASIYLGENS